MKGISMKKKVSMKQKYILLVIALVLSLPMAAQDLLEGYTPVRMGSTSGLMSSGTALPQSAVTGVTLTSETWGETHTEDIMSTPSRPRRVIEDGNWWDDPVGAPIGTTPWLLMLLLCAGYAVGTKFVGEKKKKRNLWQHDNLSMV